MSDFKAEDFAYTKSLLLSDNDMLVSAALSNNLNIILAALHVAENVASGNVSLSDESVERVAAQVALRLAKGSTLGGRVMDAEQYERCMKVQDDKIEKLEAFKSYVHQRLDAAGVPTHPEGPHSAQGCRVGDRLDLALAVIPAARKILRTLNYHIDNSPSNALPVYTGIADLRDALKAVSPAAVLQKAQSND